MINLHTVPLWLTVPACFAGGGALGYAYFRTVRVTSVLIVTGVSPLLALALTLGRLAVLCGAFYIAALAGGFALLAALAGLLCAKHLMLRAARKADA